MVSGVIQRLNGGQKSRHVVLILSIAWLAVMLKLLPVMVDGVVYFGFMVVNVLLNRISRSRKIRGRVVVLVS
jgi:hypothetical protein